MPTEDLWFTTARVRVQVSNRANETGLSILEHEMACGFSPPVHVHYHEDESFYVLSGRFRFEMDGVATIAAAGDSVHIPAGAVHSFVVLSPEGGRCLTVTQAGLEDMVREASRPAQGDGLPEQAPPTPAQQRLLADACRRNGIELLGAPLAA